MLLLGETKCRWLVCSQGKRLIFQQRQNGFDFLFCAFCSNSSHHSRDYPTPPLRPNWPFPQSNACVVGLCHSFSELFQFLPLPQGGCAKMGYSQPSAVHFPLRCLIGRGKATIRHGWPRVIGAKKPGAHLLSLFCHFVVHCFFPPVHIWRTISRYSHWLILCPNPSMPFHQVAQFSSSFPLL